MKRALIITYYWPPSGGSGVQRWVKFAKYLPSQGWQPVIYTPENPEAPSQDTSLLGDIPPEAEIVKRPIREVYSIYRQLTGKSASSKEVNPINHQKKSFSQKLMMALRGNLFIPDPRVAWVRPSVKFLTKYLREHPVDVIVSTGPPHSMHLIAKDVAAKTGTPWIADFRDPWTKMFYFKHLQLSAWAQRRHERLEKEVLDSCSAVVAVSPLVQDEFREMTSTPVHLITNGFDPEDFKGGDHGTGATADAPFNVTHTGLFASDGIPEVLWEVLADKCKADGQFARKLCIRLAGKTDLAVLDSLKAAGLERYVTDLGYQDHTVAVREQQDASMLILPLRKEPEYRATLPGKLFEYLASRRPVLGIGQTDGAMARVLSGTGAGVVCEWEDKAAIAGFVDRCWELHRSGEPWTDTDNIEQYSRTATTAKMAALMESLTRQI